MLFRSVAIIAYILHLLSQTFLFVYSLGSAAPLCLWRAFVPAYAAYSYNLTFVWGTVKYFLFAFTAVHDIEKKKEFIQFRTGIYENYEERYQGLQKFLCEKDKKFSKQVYFTRKIPVLHPVCIFPFRPDGVPAHIFFIFHQSM